MRLIDADRLKTVIVKTIEALERNPRFDGLQTIHMVCAFDTVGKIVDKAPTVDAVTVVRCKDCRWYDKVDWCNKLRISGVKAVEDTWFCADGERREE